MSLLTEKSPYLLTLVFAAIGWTTNQIWLDMTSSPIVEARRYSFDIANGLVGFRITNLSRTEYFDSIKLRIRIKKDSISKCIGQPLLVPIPPTDLGFSPNAERTRPKCETAKYAQFELPRLHPGGEVEVYINVTERTVPDLSMNSVNAVRLIESSFETFLVKNRFSILIWLLGVWCLLIITYLICTESKEKK